MTRDENVLVGIETKDDAGVYRLRDDLALVQTVDFFTPIVDDPFDYGRIAAVNSLSDIYAMGATPLTALNICAFPVEDVDAEILGRILEGGSAVAKQAGVSLLGGHTVKDAEPKYGWAVTGTVDPKKIITNAGSRPGDLLILTKPLGTGILTTARKRDLIDEAALQPAIDSMLTLNADAARAMVEVGVNAATDITGFGLLGHAGEMMQASHVGFALDAVSIPIFDRVLDLIKNDCIPGGTKDNAEAHAAFTRFADHIDPAVRMVLSDAQTSGGLLISVPRENAKKLLGAIGPSAQIIGVVLTGDGISVG